MLGTDFILRTLVADGIDHVFMVPGGLIDPFLPALGRVPEITPVVAAQEGGAAYMADGYARASGKFGVCLCIGGPGLTNTVTGALRRAHRPVAGARRSPARSPTPCRAWGCSRTPPPAHSTTD